MQTIDQIYHAYFKQQKLQLDSKQLEILSLLVELHQDILQYKLKRASKITRVFTRPKINRKIYLYGDVGRGKSMLLQAFYDNIPLVKKVRLHFHDFMRDIHHRLDVLRSSKLSKDDIIQRIAADLAQEYRLIYLDELQITDIADAMIVGRLFAEMLCHNIMLVISSNRAPQELYKDGLQRERFESFIAMIQQHLTIVSLNSPHDYRLKNEGLEQQRYLFPIDAASKHKFDLIVKNRTNGEQSSIVFIDVQGRKITCKKSWNNVVLFSFDELFVNALGSSDYKAIIQQFKTIFVDGLPELSPEDRNEAKRFVTFVDICYECRCELIILAATKIDDIYISGDGSFEFKRTISRLKQMQHDEFFKR